MPTVAVIDGMKIQFYAAEHPPPHFHVVHAEYRAQVAIEPVRILNGNLPPARLSAVLSWARPRQTALLRAWEAMQAKQRPERIE